MTDPGTAGAPAYAELHCHSNFSFLDGASHPEDLVAEAARLGLSALALTDHGGLSGVVRFARAAGTAGLPTVFGAELTLTDEALPSRTGTRSSPSGQHSPSGPHERGLTSTAVGRTGVVDPPGTHLVVLARDPEGYARLSRTIALAHLAGDGKDLPRCTLADLAGAHGGHWVVLTACRKGPLASALDTGGPRAARRRLDELVDAFGRDSLAVELWDHGDPVDTVRNDALAQLAVDRNLDVVGTNNVHYATASRWPLATVMAAVRARRPLADLDGWLAPNASAHLRSGAEQSRRFARWPGAVRTAAELGARCAFDLRLVAPGLPRGLVPDGSDDQGLLTELVQRGAVDRYGPRHAERVPGAWAQIDHELDVIGSLGYAGYFIVVHDIVELCRRRDIFCQGRGSAANSAVCYALGITQADAVALGLLFERFLSPERDGPPDIDVDIESSRRDEVIAYVYERYGRHHAAQVANVVTYRPRSAVRDVGRALGHDPATVAGWTAALDRGDAIDQVDGLPPNVARLATELLDAPRHLGLHSGGMVLCDRPVIDVCPVQWARLPGRSALQWDKEDCAAVGLVKFDLLGLGMLQALHRTVDLVRDAHDIQIDLGTIPQEDAVYDMMCRADTVGVFQIESRSQMATLPRIEPRCFADLVVEVALIRPGPIQGGSVHPYIRRRRGQEPAEPPHPLLRRALAKTLGVPLFQEQLMQIAIDAAGFSPSEADRLRQAMSAKRSQSRMAELHDRLLAGMAERGITGPAADEIVDKLAAFANFGFPESHAVSFAYLVYASAWLKLHYPAAFTAGLLDAQPMGFWSPQSLVADARRHGVVVHRPHVNHSGAATAVVWGDPSPRDGGTPGRGHHPCGDMGSEPTHGSGRAAGGAGRLARGTAGPAGSGEHLAGAQPAIRLGLSQVRGLGEDAARRIVAAQPYASIDDLVRRGHPTAAQVETLATAGALAGLPATAGRAVPGDRRRTLWAAGAVAGRTPAIGPQRLPGMVTGDDPPTLPDPDTIDDLGADLWATGLTVGPTAMELARPSLDTRGVVPAARLTAHDAGGVSGEGPAKVLVAGVVTHRQRPESARGTVFINLEDETGMVNVICSAGAWARWRHVARRAAALEVRGRLERADGVVSVVAERIRSLDLALLSRVPAPAGRPPTALPATGQPLAPPSRDFH